MRSGRNLLQARAGPRFSIVWCFDMDPYNRDGPVDDRYAPGLGASSTSRTVRASTTGVNGFGIKAMPGSHFSFGKGVWSGKPEVNSTFT